MSTNTVVVSGLTLHDSKCLPAYVY